MLALLWLAMPAFADELFFPELAPDNKCQFQCRNFHSVNEFTFNVNTCCAASDRWSDCTYVPEKAEKRIKERSSRQVMVVEAQQIFFEIQTTRVDLCCGEDEICRRRFLATELDPFDRHWFSRDSSGAFYRRATNKVYIRTDKLSEFFSKGSLKSTFAHELGHACQQAVFGIPSSCSADFADKLYLLYPHIDFNCVNQAIQWEHQLANDRRFKHCLGQWYTEAFADLIFAPPPTTYDYWRLYSSSMQDADHVNPRAYAHCVINKIPGCFIKNPSPAHRSPALTSGFSRNLLSASDSL